MELEIGATKNVVNGLGKMTKCTFFSPFSKSPFVYYICQAQLLIHFLEFRLHFFSAALPSSTEPRKI